MAPADFADHARAIFAHRFIAAEPNSRQWLEGMSWRGMWNRLAIGSWIETNR